VACASNNKGGIGKMWKKILIVILVLILVFAGYIYLNLRSLDVETLSDKLHVIRGEGSNVTVLATDAGAVIVDSMTTHLQGRLIRRKVKEITGLETVLIINTHYHLDHTHGNPSFSPSARVVSTERTLSHLKALDADFWAADAAQLLPSETFENELLLNIGGETLHLLHPGRGHTDGDLVVFIDNEQTAVMGDLLFNNYYPNIDLEAGGSVQEWPATLERVLEEDFNRAIPGHGATTNREGILAFKGFLEQLAQIGQQAARNDTTLEAVLETDQLNADAGYQEITIAGIPIGLNREFVLRRAWQESTGNFDLKN